MNAHTTIRAFSIMDYSAAYALWESIEGLGLNESDTPSAVAKFLERNPDLSAVALIEKQIVGTILCGHNGRAGHITHLAVAENYRRNGIGKDLVDYALARLGACGISRCNIFVYNDNRTGNRFWLENGWNDPSTWRVLQKHL